MNIKQEVVLEPGYTIENRATDEDFRVVKAINILKPGVGEYIKSSEVQSLMDRGIKVTIKESK
jgi:hypothetical protein